MFPSSAPLTLRGRGGSRLLQQGDEGGHRVLGLALGHLVRVRVGVGVRVGVRARARVRVSVSVRVRVRARARARVRVSVWSCGRPPRDQEQVGVGEG